MINIVLYGTFLWVLLTGYPNIMKSELLNEVDEVWGGKTLCSAKADLRKKHSEDVQRSDAEGDPLLN